MSRPSVAIALLLSLALAGCDPFRREHDEFALKAAVNLTTAEVRKTTLAFVSAHTNPKTYIYLTGQIEKSRHRVARATGFVRQLRGTDPTDELDVIRFLDAADDYLETMAELVLAPGPSRTPLDDALDRLAERFTADGVRLAHTGAELSSIDPDDIFSTAEIREAVRHVRDHYSATLRGTEFDMSLPDFVFCGPSVEPEKAPRDQVVALASQNLGCVFGQADGAVRPRPSARHF